MADTIITLSYNINAKVCFECNMGIYIDLDFIRELKAQNKLFGWVYTYGRPGAYFLPKLA